MDGRMQNKKYKRVSCYRTNPSISTISRILRKKGKVIDWSEVIQSLKIQKTDKRKKPPCDPSVDPLHCKKFSNG